MSKVVAKIIRLWWPVLLVLATVIAGVARMEQRLNHIDSVMTPEALQEYGAVKARLIVIERALERLER